jgi:hypothetical protein
MTLNPFEQLRLLHSVPDPRTAFEDVKPGSKAVFIEAGGSRRNADVIVTTQYRRYKSFLDTNNQSYIEGICFYASNGNLVANFPKQHSENCTLKGSVATLELRRNLGDSVRKIRPSPR